jgi:F-box domain
MSTRHIAMPFHPTCFDIFTRLSKQHFGKIDVHGLMTWRNLHFSDIGDKVPFSHDPNVARANKQYWAHHEGSEYLSANPLYIPGLIPILNAAGAADASFHPQHSAFAPLPSQIANRKLNTRKEDPFLDLPQEIREDIVDRLCSNDIAALRLASRAFHQLPICLWYHLLKTEMPWLWEVYSDHIPSPWTALEVTDLKSSLKDKEEFERERLRRRNVIWQEMPEILEVWDRDRDEGYVGVDVFSDAEEMARRIGRKCKREGTNWYLLYREVKKAGLKGLRNRERIWRDFGVILEEIGRLSKERGD